jgi:hypothetical protein
MLQFSIRDVMWLTAITAVATVWQIDRRSLGDQLHTEKFKLNLSELFAKDGWVAHDELRKTTAPFFACYPQPCLFCGRRPGDGKGEVVAQADSN